MAFKKGDRVHLHDGTVVQVRKRNQAIPRAKGAQENLPIRGFIRAELVDVVTGEKQTGDWHENVITTYGYGMIIRNFVGMVNSSAAKYWAIGSCSATHSSLLSNFSSGLQAEYHSTSGFSTATGAGRIVVSDQIQTLLDTFTLQQTYSYAATHLAVSSSKASLNAIAQYGHQSIGSGTALSIATFNSSEKATTQALNVTYNWVFSNA